MITFEICVYDDVLEDGAPLVLAFADTGPKTSLRRSIWRFEIRTDVRLEILHRATIWENRPSTRHKWKSDRAWYWGSNDIPARRLLPAGYLVARQPIPSSVRQKAALLASEMICFAVEST